MRVEGKCSLCVWPEARPRGNALPGPMRFCGQRRLVLLRSRRACELFATNTRDYTHQRLFNFSRLSLCSGMGRVGDKDKGSAGEVGEGHLCSEYSQFPQENSGERTHPVIPPSWPPGLYPLWCVPAACRKGDPLHGHSMPHLDCTCRGDRRANRFYPAPLVAREDRAHSPARGSRTPLSRGAARDRGADRGHSVPSCRPPPESCASRVSRALPAREPSHAARKRHTTEEYSTAVERSSTVGQP